MAFNDDYNLAVQMYKGVIGTSDESFAMYRLLRSEVIDDYKRRFHVSYIVARNMFNVVDAHQKAIPDRINDTTNISVPDFMTDEDVRRASRRIMEKNMSLQGTTLIIRHDC